MQKRTPLSIKKFILWLRILIVIAVMMRVTEAIFVFFSDYPIMLYIDGELWAKELSSFEIWDRIVVMDLAMVAAAFWFFVLYEFWGLCALYAQNKIFTYENTQRLLRVALFLIIMSVAESLTVPIVGAYLKAREIIPEMPDMNFFMLNTDLIVVALFFWLIAKVMEQAALMQEEADLTV